MISQGIILKNHAPFKQKLTIFDSKFGKIQCICPYDTYNNKHATLSVGIVLNYKIKLGSILCSLEDIEYIYMPLSMARSNIYFLHHVIELCYYFLQFNQPSYTTFKLLIELYEEDNQEYNRILCSFFLCRFFTILSIYPEDMSSYSKLFLNLISHLNSSMVNQDYDYTLWKPVLSHKDKEIKRWLMGCINTHSYSGYFKTLGFIKQL